MQDFHKMHVSSFFLKRVGNVSSGRKTGNLTCKGMLMVRQVSPSASLVSFDPIKMARWKSEGRIWAPGFREGGSLEPQVTDGKKSCCNHKMQAKHQL